MNYTIELSKKAQKFIKAQQPKQQQRILNAISKLPDEGDIKALSGQHNVYRLRVGDYRIIYEVHNDILLIVVANIGNRGQVYNSI